jgi:hypothetical protein
MLQHAGIDIVLPFPGTPCAGDRSHTIYNGEVACSYRPQFKVKVTLQLTVGQSVSLGVEPQYLLLFDSYGLVFVYAAGPRQRSLSRVQVPWISRPYFTV